MQHADRREDQAHGHGDRPVHPQEQIARRHQEEGREQARAEGRERTDEKESAESEEAAGAENIEAGSPDRLRYGGGAGNFGRGDESMFDPGAHAGPPSDRR